MATNVVRDLRRGSGNPLSSGAPSSATTEALAKLNERLVALEAAANVPAPVATEAVATIFHEASNCLHLVNAIGSELSDHTRCNWFFDETAVCLYMNDKPFCVECPTCFEQQAADSDSS